MDERGTEPADRCGVIFAAIGHRYARECVQAVQSLVRWEPALRITVYTSHAELFSGYDVDVRSLPGAQGGFGDKIAAMVDSPYENTLFLDADTVILEAVSGLFPLLSGFDLAVALECYAPDRTVELPQAFPEFNTGVILFRRSRATAAFLQAWRKAYRRQMEGCHPPKHDQPSFREALFGSSLRFTPLSARWNFRTAHPSVLEAGSSVAILHSRAAVGPITDILREGGCESRVFLPDASSLKPLRIAVLQSFGNFFLKILCWPIRGFCFVRGICSFSPSHAWNRQARLRRGCLAVADAKAYSRF